MANNSETRAKAKASVSVKTTLISVIGSVLVAALTTYGTIASNSKGIQKNADKLEALNAKATSLEKPGLPVGTVIASLLTPAEFANAVGDPDTFDLSRSKWTLADGKTASGTAWAKLRGDEPVPNLCGVFLRGKNNGKRENVREMDLGKYDPDIVGPHQHTIMVNNDTANAVRDQGPGIVYQTGHHTDGPDRLVAAWSGAETQPKNVTVNFYIKINE